MISSIPPSRRLGWFLALVFLIAAGQYLGKTQEDRSAFIRWRSNVQDLVRGENIYQTTNYPNAPVMGLILYPVSLLPRLNAGGLEIDLGALAWFALKVLMVLLAFRWTVSLVREARLPFPAWAQGLALVLSLRPILGDLSHGNINLMILFLVAAGLVAFKKGWDIRAGLLLALAATCKVTPALFLPYFLWKRAWRTLAGCVAGLALFFLVIPGVILGGDHNARLLRSWADKMITPYMVHGQVVTEQTNQSLAAVVYRLTTASPSMVDHDDRPVAFHNLFSLEPASARWMLKGLGLVFLLLAAWACRTPIRPRDNWRLAAEYSVVLIGMLLFSERTWKHHCVTLLVPYAVLCYALAALGPAAKLRLFLIAALAGSAMLIASTSTGLWEPFGLRDAAKLAQVYGTYVGAEFLLLAGLVWLLRSGGLAKASSEPSPYQVAYCRVMAEMDGLRGAVPEGTTKAQ